jgi:hypothetical protein
MEWVVNAMSKPLYRQERELVLVKAIVWASGPV